MLGAMPGKSQDAAGASSCPWQQRCAATIVAVPVPPHRPLDEERAPGEMAFDLEQGLRTAFQDKLRLQKVPAWDATMLPPTTRLLLKRREVVELERALQRQREEFWQRMERLAQRQKQLGQRREQLQDLILKFDAFLKALVARQEQALRREDRARAQVAEQDAEVSRLCQELAGLQWHREHLAQRLRSLHSFGEYLRDVLARMGQFQSVPAMVSHFRVLVGARALLAQQAEARREKLAQGRAQLQRYQEEAGSELLRTKDELAQLRAQLEATHRDVLQEESHWAHIQSTATQKTLLLGQIKLAVQNLLQLATARLKVPMDVALEDTEAQLDMVLLCMQDLAAICAELCPGQLRLCPPCLPVATSHRGAKVAPSQE